MHVARSSQSSISCNSGKSPYAASSPIAPSKAPAVPATVLIPGAMPSAVELARSMLRSCGERFWRLAVMDRFSRYVLSWVVSNSLEKSFCLEALEKALKVGRPQIFNTDQGCQFTSEEFTGRLEREGIRVSMDGRGRALDNVFVERLWRSLKYEEVYLGDYQTSSEAIGGIGKYPELYNVERPHQSLGYRTPRSVHFGG